MERRLIYPVGKTKAVRHAASFLRLPLVDHPTPDATHLLLDTPLRHEPEELAQILERLPCGITVIGGKLDIPELQTYPKIDLLEDPEYLARNAGITAHCAVKLALTNLEITPERCPVLILGWGRISKVLSALLRSMGAEVTVAARKASDLGLLKALGYRAVEFGQLSKMLHGFRLIYNTVPVKMLSDSTTFNTECVKIELASTPVLPGQYIDGRGLPGKLAAESSGRLMAETILRRI